MQVERKYVITGVSAAVILAAVLVVVLSPGGVPEDYASPEAAFAAALDRVKAGDYDAVWGFLSEKMRKSWSEGIAQQREAVRTAGPNRQVIEDFLNAQYGTSIAGFSGMNPRELYTAYLKRNAETVLELRIVGPAEVRGDRAVVRVRPRPEEPAMDWTYVRQEDGRWLVDAAEVMKRR